MSYENEIINKHLEIKQDLISNLRDVFNRSNYFTRKYRGNRLTDINVSIDFDVDQNKVIQIFIRHKDKWIKERITFNYKGLFLSNIKTNINEDD